MRRLSKTAVLVGVAGLGLAAGYATAAAAQATPSTPKDWNYEIKDGKRVPKGQRVTNADGSWREEIRQGNCVTIKERSAQGEVKVSRRCD